PRTATATSRPSAPPFTRVSASTATATAAAQASSSHAVARRDTSVEVVAQDLRAARVAELRHGLGLDLPDALTRHAVDLADLVERLGLAVGEPEAHRHDARLALRERVEDLVQLLLQEREAHRVRRDDRLGVLDEVAELAVPVLAERRVQGDRLAAVLLDLDDLLGRHVELLGELLGRGLAAQVLQHLPLDARELVDDLDHVHRDADGACLVGHGPGDRLADPPRGVRGELVALGVVELLDRTDQAEVALLDEVEEEHAATGVALRQGDDEAQVGLQEVVLGPPAVLDDPLELLEDLRADLAALGQLLLGEETSLDALGQLDLHLCVEERDLADLLEVVLHGVGGRAGHHDLLLGLVGVVGRGDDERRLLLVLLDGG